MKKYALLVTFKQQPIQWYALDKKSMLVVKILVANVLIWYIQLYPI